jgi:hypothetical protein
MNKSKYIGKKIGIVTIKDKTPKNGEFVIECECGNILVKNI